LYSLRYGSIPVVHATGGLIDTVNNATAESIDGGTATGFVFHQYDVDALENCCSRALETYSRTPEVWSKLVLAGMDQDWSWSKSATSYLSAYARARELAACEGRL
ncbi:MAG: glycogen synthase GlgA, partial [Pirellula sp.]